MVRPFFSLIDLVSFLFLSPKIFEEEVKERDVETTHLSLCSFSLFYSITDARAYSLFFNT